MHAAVALAQASERTDGPFLWIAVGVVVGLALGFAYGAVRHLLRRRR